MNFKRKILRERQDTGFLVKSGLNTPFFRKALRFIVFVGLLLCLYFQLAYKTTLSVGQLSAHFKSQLHLKNLPICLFVLLLLPVNWSLEMAKWNTLLKKHYTLSRTTVAKAILAGVTVSIFTPNRVGEYGGRALLVPKEARVHTVLATLIGSFAQWIVLIQGGLWAVCACTKLGYYENSYWDEQLLFIGSSISTLLLLFAYFNVGYTFLWLSKWKLLHKWRDKLAQYASSDYSKSHLALALFFAFTRYIVYTIQYSLVLSLAGFESTTTEAVLGVAVIYLLQTGLPIPPSTGLVARGNIALYIMAWFNASSIAQTAVLMSTFCIWGINVILPAILGSIFISQYKKSSLI